MTFFINGNPVFNKGPSNLPKKITRLNCFINLCFRKFHISGRIIIERISYFCFFLVVSNNSCGKLSPLNIFKLILKFVPVLLLTASSSFF